jgi:hypothetical protein
VSSELDELSEIDQVRHQRDIARAENMRLRREVETLRTLLTAAEAAVREEYRLRFGLSNGTGNLNNPEHL